MKLSSVLNGVLAAALLAGIGSGAWAWWSARSWRTSIPWPARGLEAGRPATEPIRAAYAQAARWPVDREAVEHLARLYLANGFNAEAAALLPGISARRPDDPAWVHRRATLLADAGQLTAAVELWQGLRVPNPGYRPVRVKLADALLKLNRGDEAAAIYRELLTVASGDPYAWYGLVRLDIQREHWAEARAKLATAIAAAPNFYGHFALLEAVARRRGDPATAEAADREVKRLGRFRDVPDPWTEAALADCFDPYRLRVDADRLRGDAEAAGTADGLVAARARLERAIALAPEDPMNYQLLATIAGLAGDEAAAAHAYEKTIALDPHRPVPYLRYANLLERQGQGEAVRALLTRAADSCPDDPDIASRLGDTCAKAGRWDVAAAAFGRLAALRPDLPDVAITAAVACFRAGQEDTGFATLNANLERHPTHEPTLGYLIMAAVHRGRKADARRLLARLVTVAPTAPATEQMRRQVQARFGEVPVNEPAGR